MSRKRVVHVGVIPHPTQRPVQFEIVRARTRWASQKPEDFLLRSRLPDSRRLETRQRARIFGHWVDKPGLDRADDGMGAMQRTKTAPI